MKQINFKKLAFTLAEVLIVLGIIGIIAEMTIPGLVLNAQNKANHAMFKKIYAQLNGVFDTIRYENGGTFIGLSSDYNILRQAFSVYFKRLNECTFTNTRNICWHDYNVIKDYKGTIILDNDNPYSDVHDADIQTFVIADSILLQTFFDDSTNGLQCNVNFGNLKYCGWMRVDINGFSKPNTIGKDIYYMLILRDRIVPMGMAGSGRYEASTTCITGGTGEGCAAYVIQNKDY